MPGVALALAASPVAQAGGAGGAVDWSRWFDNCWVAKGAASLAASYADLVGSQVPVVTVAPSLGANGWGFNGSTQFIDFDIVPGDYWSFLVALRAWTGPAFGYVFGAGNTFLQGWADLTASPFFRYSHNNAQFTTGGVVTFPGVYGVVGTLGYRDGVADCAAMTGRQIGAHTLYLGGWNNGAGLAQPAACTVAAFGIKQGTMSAGDVAAASAAFAAL